MKNEGIHDEPSSHCAYKLLASLGGEMSELFGCMRICSSSFCIPQKSPTVAGCSVPVTGIPAVCQPQLVQLTLGGQVVTVGVLS